MKTIMLILLLASFTITEDLVGNKVIRDNDSGSRITCSQDLVGNVVCR